MAVELWDDQARNLIAAMGPAAILTVDETIDCLACDVHAQVSGRCG